MIKIGYACAYYMLPVQSMQEIWAAAIVFCVHKRRIF